MKVARMITLPFIDVFVAYWCEHPELFAAIVDGKTPEDRALRVLKWFIVRSVCDLSF